MGRSALPQLRPSQRLAELAERFRHAAAHDFADIPTWSGTTAYLYARLGQTTIARKFERALEHHTRLESSPLLARTKARHARLLRDRGAAGDSGRAELLRREAEETAAALGLLTIDP